MRTRTRIATFAAGAAIVTTGVVAVALSGSGHPVPEPDTEPDIMVVHGADHLPSTTASDWATYADHVVVVEAVAEQTLAPAQVEIDRGEGLIGRTVTLEVAEVLWSSESAPQPPPKAWEYSAAGSMFKNGDVDDTTAVAVAERPRVEVGHSYVMAIRWEPAQCSEGDPMKPAGWRGLGEGSEIPYDGDTLGNGEFEGRVQTAGTFAAAADAEPDQGLEERLAGQSAESLVPELEAAQPDTAALSDLQAQEDEYSCG